MDSLKKMLFTDEEIDKCSLKKGDLLVCEGGDIGRAAIWNYDIPMCIQNHIHRLRAYRLHFYERHVQIVVDIVSRIDIGYIFESCPTPTVGDIKRQIF